MPLSEASPLIGPHASRGAHKHVRHINMCAGTLIFAIVLLLLLSYDSFLKIDVTQDMLPEETVTASVRYDKSTESFAIMLGYLGSNAIASGKFHSNVEGQGWNYLEVETLPADDSVEQYLLSMRAIGYLEGFLTWRQIADFYPNYYQSLFDTVEPNPVDPDPAIISFLLENYQWMISKSKGRCNDSAHWLTVCGIVQQLEGVVAGFQDGRLVGGEQEFDEGIDTLYTSLKAPTVIQFLLLNSNGDLIQIMEKISAEQHDRRRTTGINGEGGVSTVSDRRRDHCSAIVKLLPDGSDVLFGHNTWDDYRNMGPRIFKHYIFPSWPKGIAESECACEGPRSILRPHTYFSSSPGMLTSVDDFYTTYTVPRRQTCPCSSSGGRLAVMETSLDNHNSSLYALIKPASLLSWVRVRSANLMAIDGNDWSRRFSYDHSGTYANQWMVVDMARFSERDGVQDGLLTVLEEMPGMIQSADLTEHLKTHTYWASYNEPFFSDMSEYSGNTAFCETTRKNFVEANGPSSTSFAADRNCYSTCPRARLFRRLHGMVQNITGLQVLLRYNHFQEDEESIGDACESIACREDLQEDKLKMRAFGAVDAKVSSILRADVQRNTSSLNAIEILVQQGPTTDSQPPFCWSEFQSTQNDFYSDLRGRIVGTIGDYIKSLQNQGHSARRRVLRSSDAEYKGSKRRGRHPSIIYSHRGQPDCFTYEWTTMPPPDTPHTT